MFGITLSPKKMPVVIEDEDVEFNREYDALAKELGVACRAGGHRRKLLEYFRDNAIDIYDLAAVERYMDKKGNWGWFPLRAADQPEGSEYSVWVLERVTPTNYSSLYGASKHDMYAKSVPYPVLCSVKAISAAFPGDELIFLVAAIDSKPDPFLGCRFKNDPDRTMIVIERWDEPSFRG